MVTDMTSGRTFSVLLKFSLPMLLSVAFQQLYNIVDSVIAGIVDKKEQQSEYIYPQIYVAVCKYIIRCAEQCQHR